MQKLTFLGPLGHCFWATLLAAGLAGCSVGHLPQLDADYYRLVQTNDSTLARRVATVPHHRFYVEQDVPDTLLLYRPAAEPGPPLRYGLHRGQRVVLLRGEFDFDIFTLPFKIRPGREGVPAQLNTNFNAALYLGRRLDFFHLTRHQAPSGRTAPLIRTVGLGYGLFTGLGSADISPGLTRGHAAVDYEGFVVHSGAAVIYDARVFNVGAAVGIDYLLGGDADYWLYQRRPWFGLLFGLNLN
ncbi:hypothetical protein [Hymenobacter nivis]|uniref:Outer membrane protein beta-barrel domain-containing protein n=1 Tax=Hymenobacter nivis TaxID=1850093 RepID=A0A502GQN3_9BACT|nr:hypothetical protein [Hymenobacter nivis]TPG64439.1 hypothetical protein EAH73_14775 [Hymenobacter nivis]